MRILKQSHMLDAEGNWPRGQTSRPVSFVGCRAWTHASRLRGARMIQDREHHIES